MVSIGSTAAGAVQSCPAIPAFGMRIHIACGKFALNFGIGHTVPDVSQSEPLLANEVMSGVQITPRGDSHIFRAATATGDTLVDAGTT